jgi:hypothetical protein
MAPGCERIVLDTRNTPTPKGSIGGGGLMGELIFSTEPLLWLAGVIFLAGAGFDLIFSVDLKRKISDALVHYSFARARFVEIITRSASSFCVDILKPKKAGSFFLKSMALSIIFYTATVIFEITVHPNSLAGVIHWGFLYELMTLYAPVVIVVASVVGFDLISAYISVAYLGLAGGLSRGIHLTLVLISDIIVTAFLWFLFFPVMLSLHVTLADLQKRSAEIGVRVEKAAPINWASPANPMETNETLSRAAPLSVTAFIVESNNLVAPVPNNQFLVVSNITDTLEVGRAALDFTMLSGNTIIPVTAAASEAGISKRRYSIQHVLGLREVRGLFDTTLGLFSPAKLIFGEYYYITTRTLYFGIVGEFSDHDTWDGRTVGLWCDGKVTEIEWPKVAGFDFHSCGKYVVFHSGGPTYLSLLAGSAFEVNAALSYKAFFWSSMSVTASFYIVVVSIALCRLLVALASRWVEAKVIDTERFMFTAVSLFIDIVILFFYGLAKLVR